MKNITGNKYNQLIALNIEKSHKYDHKCLWSCICSCGNVILRERASLESGRCISCGCHIKQKKILEFVGERFNKLTVISFNKITKSKDYEWNCKCDCGNMTVVSTASLKRNNIKSCGCLQPKEWKGCEEISGVYFNIIKQGAIKRNLEFSITIHDIWNQFLKQDRRCALSGIELKFVRLYGKFCKEQTASLDRIDSSKGYIEGNIQWIHKDINMMKSNYSDEYYISICESVANYQKGVK